MTKKLQFRATALTCVLLLGMATMAQGLQPTEACDVYCPSGIMNANVNIMSYSSQKEMPKPTKANVAKAQDGMCTVTANLEYDPELFAIDNVGLYFTDMFASSGMYSSIGLFDVTGEGVYQGQAEPGVYDIIACFKQGRTPYFVIYEQYEITGDVTLTFNPESCTNCITTKNYGPDGQLLKHGLGHYDENGQFVVEEEGEVYNTNINGTICLNGLDLMNWKAQYIGPMLDEESRTCPNPIYVSDVSDRFVFSEKRIAVTEDLSRSYCCWFSSKGVETGFENDPNEYVQQVYNYKYSPYGVQQQGCGFMLALHCLDRGSWANSTFFRFNSPKPKTGDVFTHEVWANIPFNEPNIPERDILLQPIFNDYSAVNMYQSTYYPAIYAGPMLMTNGRQKTFTNIGHFLNAIPDWGLVMIDAILYRIRDYQAGSDFVKLLPAPEAFTYPSDLAMGVLNNNCPINSVLVQNNAYNKPPEFIDPTAPDGNTRFSISDYFVGRYGEQRLCGDEGVTRTLKLNGEEVDMQGEYYSVTDGTATSEYRVTNTNIDVDGLSGHNTTTIYFDQSQDDRTPPSLEMLHFRSSDGVTDRFATADDGTMEFYASDFHYQDDAGWMSGVFLCRPVEVQVEYAPYGTEEWNELAVEEIPELYQEPGWGYFYRGSLAEVTGQGEQGWFDLKFRLVDASGNWQEQVISPAFRIDNLAYSSVATVGSDNAHEVARYNLAGQRVDASTPGVAIVKMSDGTVRKVIVP